MVTFLIQVEVSTCPILTATYFNGIYVRTERKTLVQVNVLRK